MPMRRSPEAMGSRVPAWPILVFGKSRFRGRKAWKELTPSGLSNSRTPPGENSGILGVGLRRIGIRRFFLDLVEDFVDAEPVLQILVLDELQPRHRAHLHDL